MARRPSHRKPGRPSKGDRERFDAYVPADLAQQVRQDAKARGLSFADWFTEAAAEKLGRSPAIRQESLPLQIAT